MNTAGDNEREPGGDDMLAAEYVLGVLADAERGDAARRSESEPDFARLVDAWEATLAPMAAAYLPVEPPASVKQALDRRLFALGTTAPSAALARPSLWQSLAFWRVLSGAAVAALAIAIAVPALTPPPVVAPAERLVASLAADGSDVRYVAFYDDAHDRVGLSHLAGARGDGRDFELWMIEGDNPPVSLGVIPVGERTEIPLTPEERERLAQGAVLAISLEPQGGSPTGAPTGPVVAAGDLRKI